ncbi:MAG: hypothetical protein JWN95_4113 [Frankiales bacterium]|nr:hypothetical protein [Frankiales bacterium]
MNEHHAKQFDYAALLLNPLIEGTRGEVFGRGLEAHDLAAVFDELGLPADAAEMRAQALRELDQVT